jgi:hypothetical protein
MKILAWLASWTCYWLGDAVSVILNVFGNSECWANVWYPIYNNLMLWSSKIQDKYEIDGPWERWNSQ